MGLKSIHTAAESDCDDTMESENGSEEYDSTITEDDESSDLDDVDYVEKRAFFQTNMVELENQFNDLKEQYYQERLQLNKQKLEEVKAGRATEYLNPLAELEDDMRVRIHVTDRLMQLREQSVEVQRDAEIYASDRNFHNEVALCWDSIKAELEDKMRHLEEDRTNIDIHSDLWNEQSNHKKNKKKFHSIEKKKKPITVSGPFIVYLLAESKIVEDWAIIRKSMKNNKPKTEYGGGIENICRARFTDGKLTYRGDTYAKGDRITVEKVSGSPVEAQLVSVNTSEVLIEQSDGEYSRLSIADLQAGRCWLYRSSPTYT